ncbi:MAG: aspartate aminotransferase, partial [Rhodospirillaceae bacterium]|nr:aspartate aminotransferase [Rhodospirillaceae bacterium]
MRDPLPAFSPILDRFKPSAISEIFSLAARLKAEGRKIYDLSTGEPDFDTPRHIRDAAAEAMAAGDTKYSPVDGTFAMKAAVSRKFQRENALTFTNDEIVIASGAKPLLADAI